MDVVALISSLPFNVGGIPLSHSNTRELGAFEIRSHAEGAGEWDEERERQLSWSSVAATGRRKFERRPSFLGNPSAADLYHLGLDSSPLFA